MLFPNTKQPRHPVESRKQKRVRALEDIRALLRIQHKREMIIKAIMKDYGYALPSIYLLIKEAQLQIEIEEEDNGGGGRL